MIVWCLWGRDTDNLERDHPSTGTLFLIRVQKKVKRGRTVSVSIDGGGVIGHP